MNSGSSTIIGAFNQNALSASMSSSMNLTNNQAANYNRVSSFSGASTSSKDNSLISSTTSTNSSSTATIMTSSSSSSSTNSATTLIMNNAANMCASNNNNAGLGNANILFQVVTAFCIALFKRKSNNYFNALR